jgi:group I intron endonuclease
MKYIGSARDCNTRYRQHTNALYDNKHVNSHFQRAWNKYGDHLFVFEIVEQCECENLITTEQRHINMYDFAQLYKICPIAGNTYGRYKTHVDKIIELNIVNDYECGMSKVTIEKKYTLSIRTIERVLYVNKVTLRTISEVHKNMDITGSKNPMYGTKQSKEQKETASERMLGINNPACRPVIQLSIDGEYIKEWFSAVDAAKSIGIKNNAQITNTCKGAQKTCYGFKWEYANQLYINKDK